MCYIKLNVLQSAEFGKSRFFEICYIFFLEDIANLKRTVVSGFVARGLLYPMGLVSGRQMAYGWNGFQ